MFGHVVSVLTRSLGLAVGEQCLPTALDSTVSVFNPVGDVSCVFIRTDDCSLSACIISLQANDDVRLQSAFGQCAAASGVHRSAFSYLRLNNYRTSSECFVRSSDECWAGEVLQFGMESFHPFYFEAVGHRFYLVIVATGARAERRPSKIARRRFLVIRSLFAGVDAVGLAFFAH